MTSVDRAGPRRSAHSSQEAPFPIEQAQDLGLVESALLEGNLVSEALIESLVHVADASPA